MCRINSSFLFPPYDCKMHLLDTFVRYRTCAAKYFCLLCRMQGLQSTKRDAYGRLILGDIITSVNGTKVANGSDLYRILDQCKVGETVSFHLCSTGTIFLPLMAAKVLVSVLLKVTVEVLRGDKKEKIAVVLEPKLDET